jgi:hypothetical protein
MQKRFRQAGIQWTSVDIVGHALGDRELVETSTGCEGERRSAEGSWPHTLLEELARTPAAHVRRGFETTCGPTVPGETVSGAPCSRTSECGHRI